MRSTSTRLLFLLGLLLLGGRMHSQCVAITCPPNVVAYNSPGNCNAIVTFPAPNDTNTCSTGTGTQTFNMTGTLQTFTVPPGVTSLTIDASGAQGGNVSLACTATGGLGARMVGTVSVTPGEVLSIMVGQQGFTNTEDGGGGGGTFVVRAGNICLVAAGGGGGASNNIQLCGNNLNGINASITTSGTASGDGLVAGGTNGSGGGASGGSGGGGGGFLTDGIAGQGLANNNGKAYVNGGAGGTGYDNDHGGYGGGGASWFWGGNGGGGGGYSGGATSGAQPYAGGGGGGSYNSGTNQSNTAGFQTGHGRVILTWGSAGPNYTSLQAGLASGSTFPVGVTQQIFHTTDSAGSSDTCHFQVTVVDTLAPTITCNGNVIASNDPGTCTALVNYSASTATDECPTTVTLLTGMNSGSNFPVGVTTVTYEAEDAGGNTSTCSFTVTVMADDMGSQTMNICAGETLTVGSSMYTTPGVYTDTLLNGGGCDSVVTTTLTVSAPIDVSTTVNGGAITVGEAGATYQWLDCDNGNAPISGATGQTFVPAQTGNYAVQVTVGNCTSTSSCDAVVGVVQGLHQTITVYPNPSTGQVHIDMEGQSGASQVDVMDVAGKLLQSLRLDNATHAQIDLGDFENGVYFLRITTTEGQETLRVLKQD